MLNVFKLRFGTDLVAITAGAMIYYDDFYEPLLSALRMLMGMSKEEKKKKMVFRYGSFEVVGEGIVCSSRGQRK